jgi:chromosomal replication initiator protein
VRAEGEEGQDVQTSGKEIESAVMEALVARLGRERCRVWFGNRTRLEIGTDGLRIRSCDSFILERLQNRYRRDIVAAAEGVVGARLELAFELVTEAEGTMFASVATPILSGEATPLAVLPLRPSEPPVSEPCSERATNVAGSHPPSMAAAPRIPRRVYHQLDDFVVGDGNRLAFSAAQSVLPRWGEISPLTIVGPSGSGKTHLLEGIWRQARESGRLRRVASLSAEQFLTQFLDALHGTGLPSFRRKYRDLDLLILDDLQFLAGKRNTAVELQHTVDQLLRDRKQIVFSSDRPPEELAGLGDDLAARLRGGLVVAIGNADEATRRGILAQLASKKSTAVPSAILDWMAAELPGDARTLAGALHRLVAAHEVLGDELTLDFAQRTVSDLVRAGRQQVSPHDVVHVVCEVFGLEKQSLLSGEKTAHVSHPRMLAMWLMRKLTRASLTEIGKSLGRKSHTTVLSAENKVAQWIAGGKKVRLAQGECSVTDALDRLQVRLRRA